MSSFTKEVKQEVSASEMKDCCKKAHLAALIQMCSALSLSSYGTSLVFKTENLSVAKLIVKLIKEAFNCDIELSSVKRMNLNKTQIIYLRVYNHTMDILQYCGLYSPKGVVNYPQYSIIQKECCARAYLAGSFCASGSVNSPKKSNYHLEIVCEKNDHAEFIIKQAARFGITFKMIERRKKLVLYIKVAEKIGDFLRCIGSYEQLFVFEDDRIQRDFFNSLQRIDNCDLANEVKVQTAAKKQMEMIEKIVESNKLHLCDEKMIEIIELRQKYPEESLKDLCLLYEKETGTTISKSGLNHRFNKIKELYEKC